MKLVAYYRVSSAGQLDGYGIATQRADCRRWARVNGHRIVAEFQDSVTGTTDGVEREGFTEALTAVRLDRAKARHHASSGRVAEGLLVGRLDRLARALTVQEAALALTWREGASVFAADQGEILKDDPDDPMRTAMRQMQGVFAELDRRTTVKRLRDGIKAKRASGRHATGSYPFGYHGEGTGRERDAVPDETEQQVIQMIVDLRAADASYREIVAALEQGGFAAKRGGGRWLPMTVKRIYDREVARTAKR